MPSTSQAQARAMQAAAHGNGKLGIPASVAREYVAADAKRGSKKLSELAKRKKPDSVRVR